MAESQLLENRGRISSDLESKNQQTGQSVSSHNSPEITHTRNRLVSLRVGDLRAQPQLCEIRHQVSAPRLNALLEMAKTHFSFR
jgi:hypothetical protein